MGKMLFWTLPIITICNCTFVEKRKYVEVLAVVDTTSPGDFGGMAWRSCKVTERGNIQRSGAGLESRGKSALEENREAFDVRGHSK
jgi:hypothetical protein